MLAHASPLVKNVLLRYHASMSEIELLLTVSVCARVRVRAYGNNVQALGGKHKVGKMSVSAAASTAVRRVSVAPSLFALTGGKVSMIQALQDEQPLVVHESFSVGLERHHEKTHGRTEAADAATTEYVPFESLANSLAAGILETAREARTGATTAQPRVTKRQQQRELGAAFVEKMSIPKYLPCTRAINESEALRSVFVVDDKEPRKARFAWYNPNDTMVPSGWLSDGLLADIRFYFK